MREKNVAEKLIIFREGGGGGVPLRGKFRGNN